MIRDNLFRVVYEDGDILVLNKPAGLLTIKTAYDDADENLYRLARLHVKSRREKVFIVNRLDKWTSGLVIMAKSYERKKALQSFFENHSVQRLYMAEVDGSLTGSGRIVNWLVEDRFGNVFIADRGRGKRAITDYRALSSDGRTTIVEISLFTGRKNQIRLALSSIGHPVLGDAKYGREAKVKSRRLRLCCYRVAFPPESGLTVREFEIPRPFGPR